jgi:8-oxo-dGTP pyrophosphatase MutT (NUDIX family)
MVKERRNIRAILFDDSNEKIEFLLLLAHKGYSQFPQGGIDKAETEKEAIQREVFEETGLRIFKRDIIDKSKVTSRYYAKRQGDAIKVFLFAYAVRVDNNKEIIFGKGGDLHQDFQWVNLNRARKLLTKYPEQIEVFEKICKIMGFQ